MAPNHARDDELRKVNMGDSIQEKMNEETGGRGVDGTSVACERYDIG